MEDLIILKLGGAAITDKNKPFTANPGIIDQIMKQISQVDLKLIIIHGAGSFAHNLAKEFKVAHGRVKELEREYQLHGISKIRNSMQRLHQFILDAAEDNEIKTFSFPISSTMISRGKDEEEALFFEPYNYALNLEFVPISFGDIVFDITSSKFRVVSGDRIIKLLAEYFHNHSIRVIFGSDVDGLYDKDPKENGAKLLEKIKFSEIDDWLSAAGESAGVDVTGGMEGKLRQIRAISQYAERIDIINLTAENRLLDCLNPENDHIGTIFTK